MKHLRRPPQAQATVTGEPSPVVLQELAVRPRLPEEQARADVLLEQEHYLGAARPVGRTLAQVVHHHERWVALLAWGPAALKLTDRDQWIGWNDPQRVERLELVVQNRRILVLSATRRPNLASRALALDGKYVRDQVLTLCLSENDSGAPVAIAVGELASRTEAAKKTGELTTALAASIPPSNSTAPSSPPTPGTAKPKPGARSSKAAAITWFRSRPTHPRPSPSPNRSLPPAPLFYRREHRSRPRAARPPPRPRPSRRAPRLRAALCPRPDRRQTDLLSRHRSGPAHPRLLPEQPPARAGNDLRRAHSRPLGRV